MVLVSGTASFRSVKNSDVVSLVSGHGFSRAEKLLIPDYGEADFGPTSLLLPNR